MDERQPASILPEVYVYNAIAMARVDNFRTQLGESNFNQLRMTFSKEKLGFFFRCAELNALPVEEMFAGDAMIINMHIAKHKYGHSIALGCDSNDQFTLFDPNTGIWKTTESKPRKIQEDLCAYLHEIYNPIRFCVAECHIVSHNFNGSLRPKSTSVTIPGDRIPDIAATIKSHIA